MKQGKMKFLTLLLLAGTAFSTSACVFFQVSEYDQNSTGYGYHNAGAEAAQEAAQEEAMRSSEESQGGSGGSDGYTPPGS